MKRLIIVVFLIFAISDKLSAQDIHPSVTLGRNVFHVLSQIFEPEELNWLIAEQAAVVVTSQLIFSILDLRLNAYYPKIYQYIPDAKKPGFPKLLWGSIWGLSSWALSRMLIDPIVQYGVSYQRQKFVDRSEDRLLEKYEQQDGVYKLSSSNQTRSLFKSMRENMRIASKGSSELSGLALKTWVDAAFHGVILMREKSLSVIPYTVIYHVVFTAVTSYLTSWQLAYKTSVDLLESQIARLEEESMNWPEQFRNGKHRELIAQKRELQFKDQLVLDWLRIWTSNARTLDFALKYVFVSYKIHNKQLAFDSYRRVFDASFAVSNLIGWASLNNEAYVKASYAINATSQLLKHIKEIQPNQHFDVTFKEMPEFVIEFRNMAIGYTEKPLLKAEHLKFVPGVYVLTGKSGIGKSTFLRKLNGLRYVPGWATGELIFSGPSWPKIFSVNQEDYVGPYSTLSQIAGGSLSLLRKNASEYQDDWGSMLSGGEKRMLALDTAFNQKPNILILDEIFNGMDFDSIDQAQKLIKERLPEAIIIVVDHEFESHNKTGFYEHQINLERLSNPKSDQRVVDSANRSPDRSSCVNPDEYTVPWDH